MADPKKTAMDAAKAAVGRNQTVAPPSVARAIAPSARKQTTVPVTIRDELSEPVAIRFSFLGAGQGGGRIADAFWKLGYRRVAVFNTTDSDFAGLSPAIPRHSLQVGGAAKDAALAREQLKGREEEVNDLLTRAWGGETEWGMVCVSLGGGSGSGTAWPLIQLIRKRMQASGKLPRVGAVLSLPSPAEGQQLARNALSAFNELWQNKVSPIIVIDNKKIQELYRPAMSDFHDVANGTAAQLLHLFNEKAGQKSKYITFDRSELEQLLAGGIVVMGAAEIAMESLQSPADVSSAIREELATNVIAKCDLRTARKGACVFVLPGRASRDLSMEFFEAGFTQLDRIVGAAYENEIHKVIHRGVYELTDAEGKLVEDGALQAYTLVSELDPPRERLQELNRVAAFSRPPSSALAAFMGIDG